MDYEEKIRMILDWAESKPNFDTSFLEDLLEKMEEKGLTNRQEEAVDRIIKKWRIFSRE